ncbi:hypothetical protein BDN72DRAFT_928427 [Pluteus cervinus]|uniref:Uncharacterized protein n=1 Tax=Pluteus cervinus TaxID=181527 RepID=A0ACD3AC23_9AGAR|nr:hypothetical protein BDN72DRAFT_928427 [Pluteus cervinus]
MKTSSTPLVILDVNVSGLGNTNTELQIDQLPNELLEIIFFFSISLPDTRPSERSADFNSTTLAISHTCARWRSITHAFPKLWAVIEINVLPTVHILNLLSVYLNHSRDALLDLTIDTWSNPNCYTRPVAPPEGCDDKINKLVEMLKQEAKRWNRVKFSFDRPQPWASLGGMDPWCTSNLTYVNIRQPEGLYANFTNLYGAPFLTEAHWYSAVDIRIHPKYNWVSYHNLRKVSFPSMALEHTLLLLQFCQGLEYLDIYDPTWGAEHFRALPDEPVILPRLQTLAIRSMESSRLLSHLTLPNLKELTLSLHRKRATAALWAVSKMLSRSACILEKFTLVDLSSYEASILSSLTNLAPLLCNLKVLELRLESITIRTIEALMPHFQTPSTTTTNNGYPLPEEVILHFPALDELRLSGCNIKADGLISHMVEARQLLNCPLSKLEVELKTDCLPWRFLKKDEWALEKLVKDKRWESRKSLQDLCWKVRDEKSRQFVARQFYSP